MRMKTVSIALSVLMLFACKPSGGQVAPARHRFTADVLLPTTPVKDQGSNETCWIYAMLAVIETEHLAQGDSVSLSADYVSRMWLTQEGRRAFYDSDKQRTISMRGVAPMTLTLLQHYGVVGLDAYHNDDADCSALARHLAQTAHTSPTFTAYETAAGRLLDDQLGALPKAVYMFGFKYTPQEFARSVCRADEYTALTSLARLPYGDRIDLPVPDNQTHERFLNVPIDTLAAIARRSIAAGHPVLWEGDISEVGFSFSEGVADVAKKQRSGASSKGKNLDEMGQKRSRDFDTRRTTDDHCMALVGLAHDEEGRRWFVVKNSWGTDNAYGGLMYMSEDYFRLKTVAIVAQSSQVGRENLRQH